MNTFGNQLWFGSAKTRGGLFSTAVLLITMALCFSTSSWAQNNTSTYYTNSIVTNVSVVDFANNGTNNYFEVSNATTLNDAGNFTIGQNPAGSFNLAVVSGAGSAVLSSTLRVGNQGSENQLIIQNGGAFTNSTSAILGGTGTATNNLFLVTGNGSTYVLTSGDFVMSGNNSKLVVANGGRFKSTDVRYFSPSSQVAVTNGGFLQTGGISVGEAVAAIGNLFLVSGAGSIVTNTGVTAIGSSGANTTMRIEDGGTHYALATTLGSAVSSSNNLLFVTGNNSIYANGDNFLLGVGGSSNHVVIANGGKLTSPNIRYFLGPNNDIAVTNGGSVTIVASVTLGENTSATGGRLLVTGSGSSLTAASMAVGNATTGDNQVRITDGGLMEVNVLTSGSAAGNSISNVGGIYQFTAGPSITPNGVGRIAITDGTISYRNFATANIADANVGNIAFAGNNTFRLLNSSNTAVATYSFNSVANTLNPANYQRLTLMGTGSLWRSTTLNIGSGGDLLVSNSTSSVNAALSSSGSIHVVNSKVTYASNVVVSGSYISDPSTSTFLQDLTITPSGSLAGGAGDVFDFKKSFYNQSTNSSAFNLSASTVTFSGGGIHTNSVTGADVGHDATHGFANGFTPTNFGYGRLTLGSTNDIVYFNSGNGAASNALYVTWLDLSGFTNQYASVSNMITSLFRSSPNVNIYYARSDLTGINSYLNDQVFSLSDIGGGAGGFLMPAVPEPSTVMMLAIALGLLIRRKSPRE